MTSMSSVPLTALAAARGPGDNSGSAFDVDAVRADFPILTQEVYGRPLVYLDNGASSQKPTAVIEAMNTAYQTYYANVHRGAHRLSHLSTDAFEGARGKVAGFINAASEKEIVFTRGATESINLVAQTWGRKFLKPGDEIVISHMEHHANIVPWQMLAEQTGVVLRVAPIDDTGTLRFDAFKALLGKNTRLVAMTHVSNALGTVVPIARVIAAAHEAGALCLVDGCQAVPHAAVDVQALGADFYVFSSHKLYGPTGIGVLWGRYDLLAEMPPYQGGGDMIERVTFEKTTYKLPPQRFEAGTPAIVEGIGLGAAIDYVSGIGLDNIAAHESRLLAYASARLAELPGLTIIGTAKDKAAILSFTMDCAHPHDIGTIVDRAGVAVRTGHHCAQPVMDRFDIAATARASFGMYNTPAEVDALIAALGSVTELFG